MPDAKHAWPNRAACWSPAMPAIGSWISNRPVAVVPKMPLLSRTSGSNASGASILPDDRSVTRLARSTVPDDDGLALVGDSDGRDALRIDAGQRLAGNGQCVLPNLFGIVLDQARGRIMLRQLPLGDRDDL